MARLTKVRFPSIVIALVLAAGCEGAKTPTRLPARVAAPVAALTAADSAALLAADSASRRMLAATPGVPIHAGDYVTIIIAGTECVGPDALAVSGPVSYSWPGNACAQDYPAVRLGPAESDGALTFTLSHARYGIGGAQVSGSYPTFTVGLNDGWPGDADYNDVTVRVDVESGGGGVKIKVVSASGPNPGGSFTAAVKEDTIKLVADVEPAELAPDVVWELTKGGKVDVILPSPAPRGATGSFIVPRHSQGRWPAQHPGALDEKLLSYKVVATVTKDGQTYHSDTVTVSQDEIDTAREEYLEFRRDSFPGRGAFDNAFSAHFSAAEFNTGDYRVYWIEQSLLTLLEQARETVQAQLAVGGYQFHGLPITSGYRNPVHNSVHLNDPAGALESNHQYGVAVDISLQGQDVSAEEMFRLLAAATHDADGCYEPEARIRNNTQHALNHAHVDWRGGVCPVGW